MSKLLMPANSKFMLPPHPVHMHDDVVRWISELEFCDIELTFFRKLLKRNNFFTASKKKLGNYYALELKLKKFQEKNLKAMFNEVQKHEHNLSEMERKKIVANEKTLGKEHKKYRLGVEALNGSVRKIKKELFAFIEKQQKEKNIIK